MAITTNITARDKKLLVFLAVFLIVIGFVFLLLKPAYDDIQQLKTDISTAEIRQKDILYHISQVDKYKESIMEQAKVVEEGSQPYYTVLTSDEIDSLLTGAALDYGFEQSALRALSIKYPTSYMKLLPYMSGQKQDEAEETTGFYCAKARFLLFGDREMLQNFLDHMANDYTSIRLAAFTWRYYSSSKDVVDDNFILTLDLEIYMTDNRG